MLSLSKKVDYALVSLAYFVEHAGQISSARAIAVSNDLPLPLLMNILKTLHTRGILCSERGARGGYQVCVNLDKISLYELIEAVEGDELRENPVAKRLSKQPPVRALQYKLLDFLKRIPLSDLIVPGRRIDVPVELVGAKRCRCEEQGVNEEANLPLNV